VASIAAAASLSYQRHVEDIGLISAAGAFRAGRLVIGASLLVLDFGDIAEVVPDDDFGGQTGRPTGNTVGASEMAARAAVALPLYDDRLHVGLTAGVVSTDLAGARRSAPFVDAGVQYLLSRVTVGASIRNLGGHMSGNSLAEAPMPTELRAGAVFDISNVQGLGALFAADLVTSLEEGTTGVVAGVEAGLMPRVAGTLGAVGRIGYDTGPGEDGLGALRLGGGISLAGIAFDYTYQRYDFFGTIHRFGVRWSRIP
jgi:hypothetical protein